MPARRKQAGWVLSGVVFAAMAMVLVGFFQIVEGLRGRGPAPSASPSP
jgi:hypothetical protein